MKNIYWFIILAVLSLGSAVYIVCKKGKTYKASTLITFFIAVAGFAWICEFLVLGLFDAYYYELGVLQNVWAENLLGHLILNTTLYPSAALVTVTSKRRMLTLFMYVAVITLIDYLFKKTGLYEHHWWRSYMTSVTVFVILFIGSVWFDRIKEGCKGLLRAITFFFVALLILHFPAPIMLLLGKQHYHLKIISDAFKDFFLTSIIFIFSYHVLESIEVSLITCLLKKKVFEDSAVFSFDSSSVFVFEVRATDN